MMAIISARGEMWPRHPPRDEHHAHEKPLFLLVLSNMPRNHLTEPAMLYLQILMFTLDRSHVFHTLL